MKVLYEENKEVLKSLVIGLGWFFLFILMIVTAIHAVSLVLDHGEGSGLLFVIRVASPALTEIFAGIIAGGFAVNKWRKGQKISGVVVEVIWLLFAGMNLIASFQIDGGGELSPLLQSWVDFGLPISALITGSLLYVTHRLDPDHAREAAAISAKEQQDNVKFQAKHEVKTSPAFLAVEKKRAWREAIQEMANDGYEPEEIRHMLSHMPTLQEMTEQVSNAAEKAGQTFADVVNNVLGDSQPAVKMAAESTAPPPIIQQPPTENTEKGEAGQVKGENFPQP